MCRRGVLVVGGAGGFGSRLVEGILATTDFDVIVAGRGLERAARFAASCNANLDRERVAAVALNAANCRAEQLAGTNAFVIVDAAGPFQGASYDLARAAVDAGVHYIDIADSRGFVAGFGPSLDARARAAAVVLLTGASSTPALSNAVLDELTKGWAQVDEVTISLSPGNKAPSGNAVIRSILSYAGQTVTVMLDGAWVEQRGWGLTTNMEMPGLGRRWLSLCETPDLDIVPARFNVGRTVIFRAGLELPVLHLGLLAATIAVRLRLLRSLEPFAGPAQVISRLFAKFGTDLGGMVVAALGQDQDGRTVSASWNLVAQSGDGPVIPSLPVLAAIRQIADGRLTSGARACVGVFTLADIEVEMRRHKIRTWQTSQHLVAR